MSPLKLHLFWAKTIGKKNKLVWRPGKKNEKHRALPATRASRTSVSAAAAAIATSIPRGTISAMAPNSASFCSTAVADMLTEVPVGESAPAMLSGGGSREQQAGWRWRHRTWWGASSATSSGEVAGVILAGFEVVGLGCWQRAMPQEGHRRHVLYGFVQ